MVPSLFVALFVLLSAFAPRTQDRPLVSRGFVVNAPAEVVATITATCARCDWAVRGRETVLVELTLDGAYSQHVALIRGGRAQYRVLLGRLGRGAHTLAIRRDVARSAKDAGEAKVDSVDFKPIVETDQEFALISSAPFLRARPGTVEKFSDFPLLMYAETNTGGEGPGPYRLQYTVIFTNEDGGTPTDRLMATWGRTTDIEFVLGLPADTAPTTAKEVIQAEGHKWIPFAGPHVGTHPELWVATENNMVADHGAAELIRFAPAPMKVVLDHVSREAVMDQEPWTYAITAAEMLREGRIDAAALPGSGRIPDLRTFAMIEACGDVTDATLAFDLGIHRTDGTISWVSTDRGEARFRIARSGCFRASAPLGGEMRADIVVALRVRAYTRPPREGETALPKGSGRVTLTRVNSVFRVQTLQSGLTVLDRARHGQWTGSLSVPADADAVQVFCHHASCGAR
jgi:hypothetical protein